MQDFWQVLWLGIIEGITEFLPVSSTGHLLVAEHWLGRRSDLFNIAIQSGAILAVVVIFWPRLLGMLTGWRDAAQRRYLAQLLFAFLVTSIGGLVAKKLGFHLPESIVPVALALLIGGLAILVIEQHVARRPLSAQVTWRIAFWVGACQVLAGVFPGTSRSAATIFAAMLAGLTARPAAAEFAFLVGIPTMFAATAYEFMQERRGMDAAMEDWSAVGLGFIVAGLVAFLAVKWLLRYIQTHRFTIFAWYRIGLGLALLTFVH